MGEAFYETLKETLNGQFDETTAKAWKKAIDTIVKELMKGFESIMANPDEK
jgi:hemoglobin-like flavoprotein